jgi:hypothetical protein
MRLIDAEELERLFNAQIEQGATDAFDAFDDALQDALTIDAVPVVRCKDCKYYRESRVFSPTKFCFRLNHPTEPRKIGYNFGDDDFCSHGERKVGGVYAEG